jgi:membrane protein YdbS with pleckstrin-like domain
MQAHETNPVPEGPLPPGAGEPAFVADGLPRRLDPRYVRAEAVAGWISTAVISGVPLPILLAVWATGWLPNWGLVTCLVLWALGTLGLVWLTPRLPRWVYDTTDYLVRPDGVEIRRGIFWKKTVSVPRARVQHIDVSQGPVQRRFGLATLTLYTAGIHHSAVELGGVAHETALGVRDFLLREGDRDGR